MKTFKLSCKVTVSAYTAVQAGTFEEAMSKARQRDVVLGGLGSGAYQDELWVIEEADGAPSEIEAQK